jgi:hypothetical protein
MSKSGRNALPNFLKKENIQMRIMQYKGKTVQQYPPFSGR